MSLLLETIRIENGVAERFRYHQKRIQKSVEQCYSVTNLFELEGIEVPEEYSVGIVKCRILYDVRVRLISFEPYVIRPLHKLKLVYSDSIDYSLKWADRYALNLLLTQKEDADDVIIVKNGELTDISYANIALKIDGQLYTPQNCLLKGTRRQSLLDEGVIIEKRLTIDDLRLADSVLVFNAMIGLEDNIEVLTANVL